jgi:hypothetical protein
MRRWRKAAVCCVLSQRRKVKFLIFNGDDFTSLFLITSSTIYLYMALPASPCFSTVYILCSYENFLSLMRYHGRAAIKSIDLKFEECLNC